MCWCSCVSVAVVLSCQEMQRLKALCRYVPVCQPRLLHLGAYYEIIWKQNRRANELIKKTLGLCDAQGNVQERLWVEHNQKVRRCQSRHATLVAHAYCTCSCSL